MSQKINNPGYKISSKYKSVLSNNTKVSAGVITTPTKYLYNLWVNLVLKLGQVK